MKDFVTRLQKDINKLQNTIQQEGNDLIKKIKKAADKEKLERQTKELEKLIQTKLKKFEPALENLYKEAKKSAKKVGLDLTKLEKDLKKRTMAAKKKLSTAKKKKTAPKKRKTTTKKKITAKKKTTAKKKSSSSDQVSHVTQLPSNESVVEGVRLFFSPRMFRRRLLSWYDSHRKDLPWRRHWLEFEDPYHIWISEVMLQQTTITAVLPKYLEFTSQFSNCHTLAFAHEQNVRQAVAGLGYYRRFHFMHQAAKVLVDRANGNESIVWPSTKIELMKIPGVGDYTASAIASIAFNQVCPVIDGNVERVFCRIFDIRQPPNLPILKKTYMELGTQLVSPTRPGDYNQALMELGQYVCTPSKTPKCGVCPVQACCTAYQRHSQSLAPQPKLKKKRISTSLHLVVMKNHCGKFGLFQRPKSAKFLKETLGFLTCLGGERRECFVMDGGSMKKKSNDQYLGRFRHSITHHNIEANVYLRAFSNLVKGDRIHWFTQDEIEKNLISSLDRKAWHLFTKLSTK